jgi:hypothetical protein
MRWMVPILVLVVLEGCAAFATKADYFDYRAVHMARDDRERLLAMQRYAARHRDGRWYERVQREREQRDKAVFEAGKSDRAGLELYLAAFPDGVFAAQARSRLSAVALIDQRKHEEALRAQRLAEERKQKEAELTRTWVTRFLGYWAKTLISINNWGAPIEQVAQGNPEFSRAFGRAPRPRCTSDECVKYYESPYAVPVPGGTRLERSLRLMLRLRMERGQMVRAELLLPGWGFSRWQELEERRPVVDADPEARKQAIEWAIARVARVLDAVIPDRQPLQGFVLAEIAQPGIGPDGELVDTTAEDPSAPANRIQGEVPAAPEPGVAELVKPVAPEQAPDMELAPLQVGKDGRALSPAPKPDQAAVPADAPVLDMAPVVQSLPPVAQAFQTQKLRITIFASGTDAAAPAYDGLVVERIGDARLDKRPAARPHPKHSDH